MSHRGRKAKAAAKQPHREGPAQPAGGDSPGPGRGRRLRTAALVLLTVAAAAGFSAVLFEFLLPGRLPPEVVGRWRVIGGETDGAIMEFHRDGTMKSTLRTGDKEFAMDGKAEVDGKTLRTTTVNPFSGRAESGSQTIITLTDTDFVLADGKGTRTRMKRIR
jgi:uncharacterized protein (TIGR03066 family)